MNDKLADLLRYLYGLVDYDNVRAAGEVASMTPTPLGDLASGMLAVDDLRKGDYLGAAGNAVGLLPFVPGIASAVKKVSSTKPTKEMIGSKEWDDWFSGSKLVNKDGTPTIMFHGKNSEKMTDVEGVPIFLTKYSDYASEHGRTLFPTYVSLKNPVTLADEDFRMLDPYRMKRYVGKYDGAISDDPSSGSVVVFSPTQIKSAISNTGKFSKKDRDIQGYADPRLLGALGAGSLAGLLYANGKDD